MAYTGAYTVEINGRNTLIIEAPTFNADAEQLIIDLFDYDLEKLPLHFVAIASRTSGADNTVDFKLQGALSNLASTIWTDILAITDVTGTNPTTSPIAHGPTTNGAAADSIKKPFRYIKLIMADVGDTGTENITVIGVP